MEHSFVQSLSPMSKHYRFFGGIAALSDRMLDKFTHTHYPDNASVGVPSRFCDTQGGGREHHSRVKTASS